MDFLIYFVAPKWGNESLGLVERERASKREAKLKGRREEKEGEARKLDRIKEEAFKATSEIYIEPFASRAPPVFWENNEIFGEEINTGQEVFEALRRVVNVGVMWEKDLKKHCEAFKDNFHLMHLHLS